MRKSWTLINALHITSLGSIKLWADAVVEVWVVKELHQDVARESPRSDQV